LLHEASIEVAIAIPAAIQYADLHGNIAAKCRIALWKSRVNDSISVGILLEIKSKNLILK
jgi:hypothetical protein